MFLVDKYSYLINQISSQQKIIKNILNSFNNHIHIFENINEIVKKPKEELKLILEDLERGVFKYSNFQHIIVYGSINSNKENMIKRPM